MITLGWRVALADMQVKPTADLALKHKGLIVGIKSAHYAGPEWDPFTRSVEAGKIAGIPVMVDFGSGACARSRSCSNGSSGPATSIRTAMPAADAARYSTAG